MTSEPKLTWNRAEAVNLCILVESVCPQFGCHVALTGGTLYKPGERKDADLIIYRIRQAAQIDQEGLFKALWEVGIDIVHNYGWCVKATYEGKSIDLLFPEAPDHANSGDY